MKEYRARLNECTLHNALAGITVLSLRSPLGLCDISYPKRLQLLNLQSLECRRISQDLMLCYQILHGR